MNGQDDALTDHHPRGTLTLILGGARSGKSHFAQDLAERLGGDDVLFVATGQAFDDEMQRRIDRHQAERSSEWTTLEAPENVVEQLVTTYCGQPVILLDCLTLWVSNWLMASWDEARSTVSDACEQTLNEEFARLAAWAHEQVVHLIIVSGEVGLGVVPESPMGRQFRDSLGRANQTLGRYADKLYWTVAGRAVPVASLADSCDEIAASLTTLGGRR